MKYIFEAPDNWDLKECSVRIERTGEVKIERPVDHMIYEVAKTKIIPMKDDSYYGTLHERIAKCVQDLREHFSLGYIVDSCGGLQALEITTRELMNY